MHELHGPNTHSVPNPFDRSKDEATSEYAKPHERGHEHPQSRLPLHSRGPRVSEEVMALFSHWTEGRKGSTGEPPGSMGPERKPTTRDYDVEQDQVYASATAEDEVERVEAASSRSASARRILLREMGHGQPRIYNRLEVWNAAHHARMKLSLVCAVLEQESQGGKNIYGQDPNGNPWRSHSLANPQVVSEANYSGRHYHPHEEQPPHSYLWYRKHGYGPQGVGPMQLTSPELQDQANKYGGAWKVSANLRVGLDYLQSLIVQHGLQGGIAAYNGSTEYSDLILQKAAHWHNRFQIALAHAHH